MLQTPVAFIIFNRPDLTSRVFAEIRRAKPRRLLVIADGPRQDRSGEAERCAMTRAIIEQVDWDCEVLRNFSHVNLGCGRRVASGLEWVFEQTTEAIILEDDCVPHPTFFPFCEALLDRYRDDERVMHIGGNGFQFGRTDQSSSYFFSRYFPSWGWASWRRAWRHYDLEIALWPSLRHTDWLREFLDDERLLEYWQLRFDRAHAGVDVVNTWDLQWTFTCWLQNGLAILPYRTLVSNVGFGPEATHTRSASVPLANLPTAPMQFPLKHPPYVFRDREADRGFTEQLIRPRLRRRPGLYGRVSGRARAVPASIWKAFGATRSLLLR